MLRALLGAACALWACPDPRGQCQVDADCAQSQAGAFCAEGVCQGPPLATVESPSKACLRAGTGTFRVRVTRAHGGAAAATARFEAGALRGTGVREQDGALRLDVPCSFGPAGAEGAAAVLLFVADDLGHEVKLASSVVVDDRGPVLAVDAASVPASAVRGAKVPLRVTARDLSGVAGVRFSVAGGAVHDAVAQADGSFRAEVETGEVAAGVEKAEVALVGLDGLGNGAQVGATFAVTRVKWVAQLPDGAQAVGLALSSDLVVVPTMNQHLRRLNRLTGMPSPDFTLNSGFSGNLVVDGAFAYSALQDGRVCKLGLEGSVRWCCSASAPIEGSLAFGLFPSGTPGGAPVSTVLFTTTPVTGADSRVYAARELNADCKLFASLPLSSLGLGTPSIAADGTVFLAGHGVLVAARFDGLAWATQSFSRATFYEAQPALAAAAGGGTRLVGTNGIGLFESLSFPAPDGAGHRADPIVEFSTTPVAGPPTSSAPVIASDGTVLVSLPTAKTVVALGADGSVRWKVTLGAQPHPAPVLGDGGLVFVAADDGLVTALDLATGSKVWTWSAGGSIGAPLALGCDGLLYGATNTGLVFALVAGSRGPAGPWAREGHDPRGSGDGRRVVQGGPGCAEE